eukprot:UN06711
MEIRARFWCKWKGVLVSDFSCGFYDQLKNSTPDRVVRGGRALFSPIKKLSIRYELTALEVKIVP